MTDPIPQEHTHADGQQADGHRAGLGGGDGSWDERYSAADQVWSGQPNGALVAEVSTLAPGRVLDVGCGEGADAVGLAGRGWDVTALDVSGVALERAARHARDAGAQVEWVHSGLVEAQLPEGTYDLVSAQYPALARTPDRLAERALLAAVAPGGTLLVVHHVHDAETAHDHEFDPEDFVMPRDIAGLLGDGWVVEVDEVRPRAVPPSGGGTHHVDDVVLRARRLT